MPAKKKELNWDRKLNIQTTGRDDSAADAYHHPYEPTPYSVLERLAESGYIDQDNVVVDYGCGKGRVGFFLHHVLGCRTIGLEYDERIFLQAVQNSDSYNESVGEGQISGQIKVARPYVRMGGDAESPVSFLCQNAAEYEPTGADCFYFFNPFSVEILRSVLAKILDSYYEEPRTMRLFFYYPDDEYVACLMTGGAGTEMLDFVDEIDCQDLFPGKDKRERILIFEIGECN
ncbi:MAG: SAM-dependent methyltransferase [Lachnospiraceae bacterium]|nr:SAM-dependent methyltransferase [Lachnospiraceae bacterium]